MANQITTTLDDDSSGAFIGHPLYAGCLIVSATSMSAGSGAAKSNRNCRPRAESPRQIPISAGGKQTCPIRVPWSGGSRDRTSLRQ